MAVSKGQVGPKTRRSRASQREETRNRMLQAALDIIIEEGIRAVRHRSVAQRAGVSLGSTTYHFSSIEELIISAFQYWRAKALLVENPLYLSATELIADYQGGRAPEHARLALGQRIYDISVDYMASQLLGKREERMLELAFHHESVRFPALRTLVQQEWESQHAYLASVHRTLGSPAPEDDARVTAAIFRQLEQTAVMSDSPEPDMGTIRSTLRRHLSLCLDVQLADTRVVDAP